MRSVRRKDLLAGWFVLRMRGERRRRLFGGRRERVDEMERLRKAYDRY